MNNTIFGLIETITDIDFRNIFDNKACSANATVSEKETHQRAMVPVVLEKIATKFRNSRCSKPSIYGSMQLLSIKNLPPKFHQSGIKIFKIKLILDFSEIFLNQNFLSRSLLQFFKIYQRRITSSIFDFSEIFLGQNSIFL